MIIVIPANVVQTLFNAVDMVTVNLFSVGCTNPESIYCGKLSTYYLAFYFFIYTTAMPATIQAFGYPTLQMAVNLLGVLGFRTVWMQLIYGSLLPKTLPSIYLCYPISYVLLAAVYIPIVTVLFRK